MHKMSSWIGIPTVVSMTMNKLRSYPRLLVVRQKRRWTVGIVLSVGVNEVPVLPAESDFLIFLAAKMWKTGTWRMI